MHLTVCCRFLICCVMQVFCPSKGGGEQGGKVTLGPCFQGHKVTFPEVAESKQH
jgi:hypothetical protein